MAAPDPANISSSFLDESKTAGNSRELSEYEQTRARNIERNNARLRSLGLISAQEQRQSNNSALGPFVSEASTKKRKKDAARTDGSRKSLRLQGIDANVSVIGKPMNESPESKVERITKEREERVQECRETRLRAAKAVAEAGAEMAAQENPTATYEHCLMRVQTMSEKGLANRVSSIET